MELLKFLPLLLSDHEEPRLRLRAIVGAVLDVPLPPDRGLFLGSRPGITWEVIRCPVNRSIFFRWGPSLLVEANETAIPDAPARPVRPIR